MERRKVAKSEKQYLRGMIHNLSLQKWTDQDIVDYLRDEKSIDIGRSTVTKIKNQIEKEAEKWYIELRQSTYKYIATYKERLDSLLSYQKKLNDILDSSKKEETKIRAITALQSIELDIFNIFKQLPDLRIEDVKENKDDQNNEEHQYDYVGPSGLPRAISYGPEEDDERLDRKAYFGWKEGDGPLDARFKASMDEKYGLPNEPWDDPKWIQCRSCKRWFMNIVRLEMHASRYCIPEPIV
jgi:hypothetical protein